LIAVVLDSSANEQSLTYRKLGFTLETLRSDNQSPTLSFGFWFFSYPAVRLLRMRLEKTPWQQQRAASSARLFQ
jgi:hypothetical protein